MYCTQCGTANSDDIKFCMNCGAPMVRRGDTPQDRISSGPVQSPPVSEQQSASSYSGQPQYMGPPSIPTNPGRQSSYMRPPSFATNPGEVYPTHPTAGSASGRAVISMILSIISPFTCWIFLSLPGLILGKLELDAIRNGQAPKAGETLAKIGFYVGIVVTALSLILPLIWFMFFAIATIN
jgi:Domain of unknown function (DUF4190)/zinc-ribbon domain